MQFHSQDLVLQLGRLIGGQEELLRRAQRIEDRLADGDQRMDQFDQKHGETASAIGDIKKALERTTVGALERWSKDVARWLVPLGVLWMTGSLEQALAVMKLMAGGGH